MLKKFLLFNILILLLIFDCKKNTKINNNAFSLPENKENITINKNISSNVKFIPDKIIQITAERFRFIPDTITIKKGTKLRLLVKSTYVTHGFAISELNINKKLKPGKLVIIDFIADKPGEYTYFCSIYCGSGHMQMMGELIIE